MVTPTTTFREASYDALSILEEFGSDDITWNSAVDFNGGEPTLLKDFDDYIKYLRNTGHAFFCLRMD